MCENPDVKVLEVRVCKLFGPREQCLHVGRVFRFRRLLLLVAVEPLGVGRDALQHLVNRCVIQHAAHSPTHTRRVLLIVKLKIVCVCVCVFKRINNDNVTHEA